MPARGKWIVLEGIDGAGKQQLLGVVESRLNNAGIETVRRSRYMIPELVRLWKQLVAADAVDQRQAAALAAADAVVGYTRLIKPALEAGRWVLMDSFTTDHRVYFQLRGVPKAELVALFSTVPLPDQIFYLHTPVADALRRGRAFGRLDLWSAGMDTSGTSIGQAWAKRQSLSQTQIEAAFLSWQARAQALFPANLPDKRVTTLSGQQDTAALASLILGSFPIE
jgi:dTMP kinase